MQYLSVKNLKQYQHYSKRNPPWVKLHRLFMTDYDLQRFSPTTRLFFAFCWLLASETDNRIPYDLKYLSQRMGMNVTETVISPLLASTLLSSVSDSVSDSTLTENSMMLASRLQGASKSLANGKRPFSEDLTPTEKHKTLAAQWKLDLGHEWGKFKNYCLAHDKRYSNFEAAFRNWLARTYEQRGTNRSH